jgi:uncharacterized protein (UPF0261 family)
MPTVVLLGSLDTKGRECAYVKECLLEAGASPVVVDFGVLADPPFPPDIPAGAVAEAGGGSLDRLRFSREGSDTRAVALKTMAAGLARILDGLRADGRCDAVIGLGGSGGTSVVSEAMRSLPLGLPKLVVSTMACGNIGGYVGTRDLTFMYSVSDIAGLNRISRPILRNAAFGIAGMARAGGGPAAEARPLAAVTMSGITTLGGLRVIQGLEAAGFETVVFHVNGSGRAMEELIDQGLIDGVIDFNVSEMTDYVLGGAFHAGPGRLEAAARTGIPQVVVPGSIEVLNFGPRDTVPERYDQPERKLIVHNPFVSAVRINLEESEQLGALLARKVSAATGPTAVLLPLRGLDRYEQPPDGPWIDTEKDAALFEAIRSHLRPDIPVRALEANINDPEFADAAVATFLELWDCSGRERPR